MNRYTIGLDLGQAADYSALAILERQSTGPQSEFHCRHLQRWPLKTSYPTVVADTVALVGSAPLQRPGVGRATLCVDATGCGAPVVDLFRRETIHADLQPIQIVGGATVSTDGDLTRVPKRDLISTAQVALQAGRLKIAPGLPESQTLVRELETYQVKINIESGNDSYGAWRQGKHDDLVLAVCLALWWATHKGESTLRQYNYKVGTHEDDDETVGPGIPDSRAPQAFRFQSAGDVKW
jgi:hypothetical protein